MMIEWTFQSEFNWLNNYQQQNSTDQLHWLTCQFSYWIRQLEAEKFDENLTT